MTPLRVAGAVLVVAAAAVFAHHVRRLRQAARWLHEHEQAHCGQLGELQEVVAQLVDHLDNATATPLTRGLLEFATRVRDDQ